MAAVLVGEEVTDLVVGLSVLDHPANGAAHVDGDVRSGLRHGLVFADDAADFPHHGLGALLQAGIRQRAIACHLNQEGKKDCRDHAGAPAGAATGLGSMAGGASVSVISTFRRNRPASAKNPPIAIRPAPPNTKSISGWCVIWMRHTPGVSRIVSPRFTYMSPPSVLRMATSVVAVSATW